MAISLKAARVNAGLSRREVVTDLFKRDSIKITENTLANYENKATQPDIITAKAIVSIYGMSVDDIQWGA